MVTFDTSTIRLGLPKGRMEQGVFKLLRDANIEVSLGSRAYRPKTVLHQVEIKLQKPQNIIEMLSAGSRDIGFAGKDWAEELQADLVELLDTELDPIKLVAAAPAEMARRLQRKGAVAKSLVVASEFERITKEWITRRELDASFVRSYGATEVFPPEDADIVVDITQTGATLEANELVVIDELLESSTRMFASPRALENQEKRERIEGLVMILRSVLDARQRAFVTLNVDKASLDGVLSILPRMREPTVQTLSRDMGFAVSVAVPRASLANLIPRIKSHGGTDIVVTAIAQLIP